jgi:hypothetical protein
MTFRPGLWRRLWRRHAANLAGPASIATMCGPKQMPVKFAQKIRAENSHWACQRELQAFGERALMRALIG